jgi:hypothetical protein
MNDVIPDEFGVTPTVEVVVYRHGEEIHRELCETAEDAALVVERWSEEDGVECEVDDLAVHHTPDDILEPAPDEFRDDEYRPPAEQ